MIVSVETFPPPFPPLPFFPLLSLFLPPPPLSPSPFPPLPFPSFFSFYFFPSLPFPSPAAKEEARAR